MIKSDQSGPLLQYYNFIQQFLVPVSLLKVVKIIAKRFFIVEQEIPLYLWLRSAKRPVARPSYPGEGVGCCLNFKFIIKRQKLQLEKPNKKLIVRSNNFLFQKYPSLGIAIQQC